jgi:hypothetical protein
MERVNSETISLERLREFLAAAELLSHNELPMIFGFHYETITELSSLIQHLRELLARREQREYAKQTRKKGR